MKKKLLSIAAACVLGVQAIAMPMIANAEQGTHYVEKSDFNDVSIGGAKGTGYYGLGISGQTVIRQVRATVQVQCISITETLLRQWDLMVSPNMTFV